MNTQKDIYDTIEEELLKLADDAKKKEKLKKKLKLYHSVKLNIMLVGATGCGKSSTINALFNCADLEIKDAKNTKADGIKPFVEMAKVGTRSDPETKDIDKYTIGNLVVWDTPGLGDGTEIDKHHKQVIRELLQEKDDEGNLLIDLVLVILDGSSRDLGTSYKILHDVIIPQIGNDPKRILIALNQSDVAMKTGKHWDYEKNEPDEILLQFLEEKVVSIKERIFKDCGLKTQPVYYCAGYEETNGAKVYPYNLTKLLYYILKSIPSKKRIPIMKSLNTEKKNYKYNDDDYQIRVKESLVEAVLEAANEGADIGKIILGVPGAVIGGIVGGIVGGVIKLFEDNI